MPFLTAGNQLSRGQDVTVLASGTVAATGQSAGVDVGGAGTLRAQINVTAVTGTLTVTIQTSHDNGVTDAWRTAGAAYSGITTVSSSPWQSFAVDRYVRVSYVVVTGPVTFSVLGEAV